MKQTLHTNLMYSKRTFKRGQTLSRPFIFDNKPGSRHNEYTRITTVINQVTRSKPSRLRYLRSLKNDYVCFALRALIQLAIALSWFRRTRRPGINEGSWKLLESENFGPFYHGSCRRSYRSRLTRLLSYKGDCQPRSVGICCTYLIKAISGVLKIW